MRVFEAHKSYQKMAGPLLIMVMLFYFTFHAMTGERGLYALLKEQRKLEVLQAQLQDTVAERKALEHRVGLMSAGSLDLDLLDEQSRSVLGTSRADERIIPVSQAPIR